MNNRRYEKIKNYVKVAREELMDSLGMTETLVDRILTIVIKDSKGDYVSTEDMEFYMTITKSPDDYILISIIADELVDFMKGGLLPEEA